MRIRGKYAILSIEDEDGKTHEIAKVDLQQDTRVICDFGEWWINDNPDIPEDLHDTDIIAEHFREWLHAGDSGETFWSPDDGT